MKTTKQLVFWSMALAGCVAGQAVANEATGVCGVCDAQADVEGDTSGIVLRSNIDWRDVGDVNHVEYDITRVECYEGESFERLNIAVTEDLAPLDLPGRIPAFEDNPLDSTSAHPFSDHFQTLPPGCYDVIATPLREDGSASGSCERGFADGAVVKEGETTEILLISQCENEQIGALDTLVALNREPSLREVSFFPSKFVTPCETTIVCATAEDPDGDPVEFQWQQLGGAQLQGWVFLRQRDGNATTECVAIDPAPVGDYQLRVQVFDLLRDDCGDLIRFEDWLIDHSYPSTRSRASLELPLYVGM